MRKVDLNKKLKDKLSKKTVELASSIAKNVNVYFFSQISFLVFILSAYFIYSVVHIFCLGSWICFSW